MTGQTISHYRILEKLGEGGVGIVYKAEDLNLHRNVALKFLRADTLGDPQVHSRFWKEAEAAAALDHPNIPTIHEISEADGQTFIAMAFIEGESLAAKIKQRPLPLDEALRIAVQIGEALRVAHERGIVHRDIKPGNIMITPDGRVKAMDFGLAHLAGQTRITKTGTIMGTPAYMSPEQAEGRHLDRRTDIWSLGVVLYEMVTGQLPFRGETDHAVLRAILDDQPEPMTAIRVGTPPELDRIVGKALEKDPARRYQDADDWLVDLRSLERGNAIDVTGNARRVTPAASGPMKAADRRVVPWGAVLGVTVVAILAAVLYRQFGSAESRFDPSKYSLRQLTHDEGLTFQPTLSRDGKLVAYASDRRGGENLDLYIQQISGASATRITEHPADDYAPHFSPSGDRIVFRSDREPVGVYVVNVLGDQPPRLLAEGGREPRFSPDGQMVTFRRGPRPLYSEIYVVEASGSKETRIAADFESTINPINGDKLLFDVPGRDWWVCAIAGEPCNATGAMERIRRLSLKTNTPRISSATSASDWLPGGREVIFAAASGSDARLWSLPLDPTDGSATGDPIPLTFGSGLPLSPTVASTGVVAFGQMDQRLDIVSLPSGAPSQTPTLLVSDVALNSDFSISEDGSKLAYISARSGRVDVRVKDLITNETISLTDSLESERNALISPDGRTVAYQSKGRILAVPSAGGPPRELCSDCPGIRHWSSDSKRILRDGSRLGWLAVASGQTHVLHEDEIPQWDARFSPGDGWISFHMWVNEDGERDYNRRRLFIAKVQGTTLAPRNQWISISDGQQYEGFAAWAPDGRALYFWSDRGETATMLKQPLDPETKIPDGPHEEIVAFRY